MANFSTLSLLSIFPLLFVTLFCIPAAGADPPKGIMRYHNGPVLSPKISINIIWYGHWPASHKSIIRDFINSFNAPNTRSPSVADWWRAITLYTDVTGANVSSSVTLGTETYDRGSHGQTLTPLLIQSVIATAITAKTNPIPADPKGGIYLVLTSKDVYVQTFCTSVCGIHYFTFPSIVGYTLPFIWVGNSAKMCPATCAWPYVVPYYMRGVKPLKAPNGVATVDAMVDVIGHKLAELATNPLGNGWYVGDGAVNAQREVGDLCQGIYGVGGGSSYVGKVLHDANGAVYNMYGTHRVFLVQWVWSHVADRCVGSM